MINFHIPISTSSFSWEDYLLFFSSIPLIILSGLHEWAGVKAYIQGTTLGVFYKDNWIPNTPKQNTLLGVFFMISFSWWQSLIMIDIILLIGNPLGIWLGVIILIFTIPQLILLYQYVKWNKLAKFTFLFHILSATVWLVVKIA